MHKSYRSRRPVLDRGSVALRRHVALCFLRLRRRRADAPRGARSARASARPRSAPGVRCASSDAAPPHCAGAQRGAGSEAAGEIHGSPARTRPRVTDVPRACAARVRRRATREEATPRGAPRRRRASTCRRVVWRSIVVVLRRGGRFVVHVALRADHGRPQFPHVSHGHRGELEKGQVQGVRSCVRVLLLLLLRGRAQVGRSEAPAADGRGPGARGR